MLTMRKAIPYLLSVVINHIRSKHHDDGSQEKCSKVA